VSAPTYEELAALVVALQARMAEQDAEIAELKRRLAALRNGQRCCMIVVRGWSGPARRRAPGAAGLAQAGVAL